MGFSLFLNILCKVKSTDNLLANSGGKYAGKAIAVRYAGLTHPSWKLER